MKSIAAAFLFLAFLVAGCATPMSAVERAHQSTLRLTMDDGGCSGTAIGPHAILSATHCFLGAHSLEINGEPVVVTGAISDGNDHTIVFVDRTFADFATRGPAPAQADPVFILGNPGGFRDLYRAGRVAGTSVNGKVRYTVYDLNDFFGDSGSGIFNEQGRLVGVISLVLVLDNHGIQAKFAASLPMAFTPQQWAQAAAVDVPPASP